MVSDPARLAAGSHCGGTARAGASVMQQHAGVLGEQRHQCPPPRLEADLLAGHAAASKVIQAERDSPVAGQVNADEVSEPRMQDCRAPAAEAGISVPGR